MSNIDKITANEELFTELTLDEGASISGGGYEYTLRNDTNKKQYFYTYDAFFEVKLRNLKPDGEISFNSGQEKVYVLFDKDATNKLEPYTQEIMPGGTYRFDQAVGSNTIDLVQGIMSA